MMPLMRVLSKLADDHGREPVVIYFFNVDRKALYPSDFGNKRSSFENGSFQRP